ncbi:MAG: NO-inducible flavohemoprotein [Duodenibacillus sp.]|nr:NO-inducible flavohemoprotein [Duodenibacillus sp.]
MLTARQIELIKATIPVLRESGVALTSYFYKRMLGGNPELRNIFNSGHQARGHQQQALAAAVLAYAENIENPAVLLGAVKHIATKHVTVGIRAEHYPIVGKHLLASIKEVLGDAASDELIDAWAAAYGQLADILINVESGIYKEQATADGGWSGWRPFVVAKKVVETPDVTSFYLKPADKGQVPSYKPGQFVSVRTYVPSVDLVQPRQYSLSRAAGDTEALRISVKRVDAADVTPAGLVSNHLHANLNEGDTIDVSAPTGEFFLNEGNNPVVLASAGIGITPILAMLQDIAAKTPEREVLFVHVCKNSDDFALKADVRAALSQLKNARAAVFMTRANDCDGSCTCSCVRKGARPDADAIKALAPKADSDVFVCGPAGFMKDMVAAFAAAGVEAARIRFEAFGTGHQS